MAPALGLSGFAMPHKPDEYHLIDTATGTSHGGFATLTGARIHAREHGLEVWQIWHGNTLVERHNPLDKR